MFSFIFLNIVLISSLLGVQLEPHKYWDYSDLVYLDIHSALREGSTSGKPILVIMTHDASSAADFAATFAKAPDLHSQLQESFILSRIDWPPRALATSEALLNADITFEEIRAVWQQGLTPAPFADMVFSTFSRGTWLFPRIMVVEPHSHVVRLDYFNAARVPAGAPLLEEFGVGRMSASALATLTTRDLFGNVTDPYYYHTASELVKTVEAVRKRLEMTEHSGKHFEVYKDAWFSSIPRPITLLPRLTLSFLAFFCAFLWFILLASCRLCCYQRVPRGAVALSGKRLLPSGTLLRKGFSAVVYIPETLHWVVPIPNLPSEKAYTFAAAWKASVVPSEVFAKTSEGVAPAQALSQYAVRTITMAFLKNMQHQGTSIEAASAAVLADDSCKGLVRNLTVSLGPLVRDLILLLRWRTIRHQLYCPSLPFTEPHTARISRTTAVPGIARARRMPRAQPRQGCVSAQDGIKGNLSEIEQHITGIWLPWTPWRYLLCSLCERLRRGDSTDSPNWLGSRSRFLLEQLEDATRHTSDYQLIWLEGLLPQ